MRTKSLESGRIPRTYAELAGRLMPRPIRDRVDHQNALAMLDSMAGFKLNADQEDYFDALATFVERYEAERKFLGRAKLTPAELLRSLLEEHGLSASDLGRLLGDRSLGQRILSGQRQLSKGHIRTLAEHFRLNPAALL
jgi:HTH-type transcriptional regulator / antitoxin HigA